MYSFKNGPWPMCEHCNIKRATSDFWAGHGHYIIKRHKRSKKYNTPLIFKGKFVCEHCLMMEQQQEKRQLISTNYQSNIYGEIDGVSDRKLLTQAIKGMRKVIAEAKAASS